MHFATLRYLPLLVAFATYRNQNKENSFANRKKEYDSLTFLDVNTMTGAGGNAVRYTAVPVCSTGKLKNIVEYCLYKHAFSNAFNNNEQKLAQ